MLVDWRKSGWDWGGLEFRSVPCSYLCSPAYSCWVSETGTDLETRCDQELEAMLSNSDEAATVDLIDVRTPEQFSIVSIPGSRSAHLLLLVFP